MEQRGDSLGVEEAREAEEEQERRNNERLVSEAIRRILMDMIVRGHGLRLIGRWSRDAQVEELLEQVPYLLDRINQLHLACERSETSERNERSHKQQHSSHLHHRRRTQDSVHEFVQLIGSDHHWLVRTRDTLGLTPLHKSVLHNNRPIAELILDRYSQEMAPAAQVARRAATSTSHKSGEQDNYSSERHFTQTSSTVRLIDAQDKFGRTPLHYAAAFFTPTGSFNLFELLLRKGASKKIRDFRGKTAGYYLDYPNELRLKCVLQLASKKNAQYQANVLNRILNSALLDRPIGGLSSSSKACSSDSLQQFGFHGPISSSCTELRLSKEEEHCQSSRRTNKHESGGRARETVRSNSCVGLSDCNETLRLATECGPLEDSWPSSSEKETNKGRVRAPLSESGHSLEQKVDSRATVTLSSASGRSLCSSGEEEVKEQVDVMQTRQSPKRTSGRVSGEEGQLKRLIANRSERPVLNAATKEAISRALKDANMARIQELLMQGFGRELLRQSPVCCWNLHCRRYLNKVVDDLLKLVDVLHEHIATNHLRELKSLLEKKPILARIRRPYKGGALNALHLAVNFNRKTMVNFLIQRFPELLTEADSNGATCLHWAAKSLNSERIYCWLNEHFGSQLEQLRDCKNRTASDYRQQAIKLASFDRDNWPMHEDSGYLSRRDVQVQSILSKNQERENELFLEGRASKLAARQIKASHQDNFESLIRSKRERKNGKGKRDGEEAEIVRGPVQSGEESWEKETERDKKQTETGSNLDQHSDAELANASRSKEEIENTERQMGAELDCADLTVTKSVENNAAEEQDRQQQTEASMLMGELAQLDTGVLEPAGGASFQSESPPESHNKRGPHTIDRQSLGAAQTPIDESRVQRGALVELVAPEERGSPVLRVNSTARQQQSTEPRPRKGTNLDSTIRDSLSSNDFKKLDYLILAGCGRRIHEIAFGSPLASSGQQFGPSGGQRTQLEAVKPTLSEQMRDYLTGRAMERMETIETIHRCLHECFPITDPSNRDQESRKRHPMGASSVDRRLSESASMTNEAERGRPKIDNNFLDPIDKFHKFSTLMQRSCFVVARDRFGASPVHVAAMRADKRLLDYLLRRNPEAASAPDHEGRNVLHYSAMVLAFYLSHGVSARDKGRSPEIWLTTRQHSLAQMDSSQQSQSAKAFVRPTAYWAINENAKIIFDNLSARYGEELRDFCDRSGKSFHDYSQTDHNSSQGKHAKAHTWLSVNEMHEPREIAACCPEYSGLLARYDYLIWPRLEEETHLEMRKSTGRSVGSPESMERNDQSTANQDPGNSNRSQVTGNRSSSHASEDELIVESEVVDQQGDIAQDCVSQAAPMTTTGCELSYSPVAVESSSEVISRDALSKEVGRRERRMQAQIRRQNSQTSRKATEKLWKGLEDECDPFDRLGPPVNERPLSSPPNGASSMHSSKGAKSGRRSRRRSIVGGVIVPTIVHNDKMDEIETYDIIYRQPPSEKHRHSSSSSSSSIENGNHLQQGGSLSHDDGFRSSKVDGLDLASFEIERGPIRATKVAGGRQFQMSRQEEPGLSQAQERGQIGRDGSEKEFADDEQRADDEDEDDYEADDDFDDRVERLSHEFEDRVRKEKNELRAKVDQIMRQIKSSAKSGKSSRLLASPNNPVSNVATNGTNDSQDLLSTDCHLNKLSPFAPTKHQQTNSGGRGSCSSSVSTSSSQSCSSSDCFQTSSKGRSSTDSNGSHSIQSTYSSTRSNLSSSNSGQSETRSSRNSSNKIHSTGPLATGQQTNLMDTTSQLMMLVGQHQAVSKNTHGQTYLHFIASRSQSSSTLFKVLDHASHLIAERDVFYRTARDVALQFNLANNVQVLDKFIIDLFIGSRTQLLWLLLTQGYSPLIHVADPDGNDIMLILKLLKLERMIRYLLQMADFQRWRDELHTFIRHGYSAGVSELIRKHRDLVRAKSVYSRTSVHLAVLFDRCDMVKELIEADGLSVHATDNMGRTPLHYTYGLNLNNGEEIRTKLLACGASLEARDVRMRTPKYYYIFRREIEEIRRIELELN